MSRPLVAIVRPHWSFFVFTCERYGWGPRVAREADQLDVRWLWFGLQWNWGE